MNWEDFDFIDFYLKLNCKFTDDEKEECVSVANKMEGICKYGRQKGLLALEDIAKDESDIFLKTGLYLCVNGTHPSDMTHILQLMILGDESTGVKLLSELLIMHGLQSLMMGVNPRLVKIALFSLLGEKYLEQEKLILYTLEESK